MDVKWRRQSPLLHVDGHVMENGEGKCTYTGDFDFL
jgi:hypothetical protein